MNSFFLLGVATAKAGELSVIWRLIPKEGFGENGLGILRGRQP